MAVKMRLLVIGSGWGGFQLLKNLRLDRFDVTMVSPRNHFVHTPLLVSATANILRLESVMEPARLPGVRFIEAESRSVNLTSKTVGCVRETTQFELEFDRLVIACGAQTNTYGIPGIEEHAYFLKDADHARRIQSRVLECLEAASVPGVSDDRVSQLLRFICVGGGPTGVELFLELSYWIADLRRQYPELVDKVRMMVVEVAPAILASLDPKLAEPVVAKLKERGIQVETGRTVKEVTSDSIVMDGGETCKWGLLVWTAGVKPGPLVNQMKGAAKHLSGRILVDGYLRVLDATTIKPISDDVYAIGDCATTADNLPCTAQVAKQQAQYLASLLSKTEAGESPVALAPFQYRERGTIICTGGGTAAVEMPIWGSTRRITGSIGGLIRALVYWSMFGTWRNQWQTMADWASTWMFGRSSSRLK